jgi:hypothetical protein
MHGRAIHGAMMQWPPKRSHRITQRRTAILRYASWAAVFPISRAAPLPFDCGHLDQSREWRDGPKQTFGDTERQRDENKLPRSSAASSVVWIVDDFPQMSIRVAKVTGVDAPRSVVQFSDGCSGRLSFG